MNNINLDENQLQKIHFFIWEKGLKEPDLINEVFDHFACKVEELMNNNIYLPLDKAMREAYFSFGKDGFKIITAQYVKAVKRQYWINYKLSMKEMLRTKYFALSFFWMVALAGFVVLLSVNKIENWLNDFCVALIFISMFYMLSKMLFKTFKKDPDFDFVFSDKQRMKWHKTILRMPKIAMINLIAIFAINFFKLDFLILLYCFLLMSALSLLDTICRYETTKKLTQKLKIR